MQVTAVGEAFASGHKRLQVEGLTRAGRPISTCAEHWVSQVRYTLGLGSF